MRRHVRFLYSWHLLSHWFYRESLSPREWCDHKETGTGSIRAALHVDYSSGILLIAYGPTQV